MQEDLLRKMSGEALPYQRRKEMVLVSRWPQRSTWTRVFHLAAGLPMRRFTRQRLHLHPFFSLP